MPYIPDYDRDLYQTPMTPGQLNWHVTKLCHNYIEYNGVSYSNVNEVIGVLECAKLELYRQVASPYEDKKKRENGAISTLDA